MKTKYGKKIIFAVLTLSSLLSFAEYYSEVDLRQPGFSMEHIPVMNQNTYGLCYSYTAAAMVDAYRLSHPETEPDGKNSLDHLTSPLMPAFIAFKNKNFFNFFVTDPTKLGGGFICDAVRTIKKHGSCNEKIVNTIEKWRLDYLLSKYETYLNLHKEVESLKEKHQATGSYRDELLNLVEKLSASYKELLNDSLLKDAKERLKKDPTSITGYKNQIEFLFNNVFEKCSEENVTIAVKTPQCLATNFPGKTIALEMIHQQLNKNNPQPIGIGYCSNILKEGKAYRGNFDALMSLTNKKECGPHASLIIGRRVVSDGPEKSKVQFLIRNSWGNSCSQYSTDWDCDYRGDIWVDAEILGKSLMSIEFFN